MIELLLELDALDGGDIMFRLWARLVTSRMIASELVSCGMSFTNEQLSNGKLRSGAA